jgi:hypothetical protein
VSQKEYAQLVMTTIMQDGHHHDGTEASTDSEHPRRKDAGESEATPEKAMRASGPAMP